MHTMRPGPSQGGAGLQMISCDDQAAEEEEEEEGGGRDIDPILFDHNPPSLPFPSTNASLMHT